MFRILLVLLLFSFQLIGQTTTTLSVSIKDCPDGTKKVLLFIEMNGKDSLIFRDSLPGCSGTFTFPKFIGNYRVSISAPQYTGVSKKFSIDETVPDSLTLAPVTLVKEAKQLDEFTVTGIKRNLIQVDADKTTVTVKDNPVLSTASIYDALLKIPGIVPFPGGGFTVSGKGASVYFESVPSNLNGEDLTNLLKSLPANSVEKIEITSNPGASYDANVSGAIIDIITLSKVSKWISGTITLNSGYNTNVKLLPSLVISGKNKKYSWQLSTGYSYIERTYKGNNDRNYTTFSPMVQMIAKDKDTTKGATTYFKPSVTFKLNRNTTVTANYNLNINEGKNRGESISESVGLPFNIDLNNNYSGHRNGLTNEGTVKYKTRLDTLKRSLEITANYLNFEQRRTNKSTQTINGTSNYNLLHYELNQNRFYVKSDLDVPFEKVKVLLRGGIKYSWLEARNIGFYNLQDTSASILDHPIYTSIIDFLYRESNLAGYIEVKKTIKKLSLGAGLRAENFQLTPRGTTIPTAITTNYFNFFPSFNGIYRFNRDMNLIASYSRKIGIPHYSQFDPNNSSGDYDAYNTSAGNPLLKPNFYSNSEVKFTAFDYFQLSVDHSYSTSLNLNEIVVAPNSLQVTNTFRTYNNIQTLSYNLAIPIPFGIFTQGLAFFDQALDVDKLNFMYLYAERTSTKIAGYNYVNDNKPQWNMGVYSQFILPWKVRMNIDYYVGTKGTYLIYELTKNNSALEFVFSREFMDKKWKTSLSFEDIFNTSQYTGRSSFKNIDFNNYNKDDTRVIWFKVSYSFGKYEKPESDEEIGPIGGGNENAVEPVK